jgi:hypothetical protein
MSFATGLQMGFTEHQRDVDNRRTAELHAMQMKEMQRRQQREDALDTEFKNYADQYGMGNAVQAVQAPIQQRYGMTPEQQAAAGPELQAKLRSYDVPDSYDLQTTPQGAPSAYEAGVRSGVDVQSAKDRNLLGIRQRINALSRNTQGLAAGEAEGKQIDLDQDLRQTMTMVSDPAFRSRLNKFINEQSPRVSISRAKDEKTGKETGPYMATVIDRKGEGQLIPLSDAQYMQLAHAHVLASRGMMDKADAITRGVNKDLADAIKGYNEQAINTGTFNERGRHQFELEALARQKNANDAAYQNRALKATELRNPTLSDEMKGKLSAAIEAYYKAPDAASRQRAKGDYEALLARANLEMGKPAGRLGAEPKPALPFDKWFEASASAPSALFNDNGRPIPVSKLNPRQLQQEYQYSQSADDDAGGLPDAWGKPAPSAPSSWGGENRGATRGVPAPTATRAPAPAPAPAPSAPYQGIQHPALDKPLIEAIPEWIRAGRPALSRPLLDIGQ